MLLTAGLAISDDPKAMLPDEKLVSALEFMRTIAALRSYTAFMLSPQLRTFVLNLIIRPTGRSDRAVNFICFCLAFIIGLRSCLIDHTVSGNEAVNSETEDQLVVWLRRLISRQEVLHTSLRQSPSYSELLLLLALLFNNNRQSAIRDIVASVLCIDAPCLMRNISASRKLFIQKVFTYQSIATHAAHVPVTVGLSAQLTGNLPIHCVYQLLKTHAFSKNRVQIKGWIYQQICESVRPLHPLLPDVIETYTSNALTLVSSPGSTFVTPSGGCMPFTEQELRAQFTSQSAGRVACACAPAASGCVGDKANGDDLERDLTPQLLFFYYMLYIYDQELNARAADNRGHQRNHARQSLSLFSDQLWDAVPATYLLQYARSNLGAYRKFYPRLLQLVTNHMPHLTIGETIIQDELLLDPFWQSAYNSRSADSLCLARSRVTRSQIPSPDELLSIFDRILDPSGVDDSAIPIRECILGVNALGASVVGQTGFSRLQRLLPYVEPIACRLPRVLLESAVLSGNRRFSAVCCSLWRSLHSFMPQRLEVLTIKALSQRKEGGVAKAHRTPLTHRDLFMDPVENVVMAVDPMVYRCPPVLHILIRILECNLLASRSFWLHRVADRFFLASSTPATSERQQGSTGGGPPPLIPITGETEPLAAKAFTTGKKVGGGGRLSLEPIPGADGSAPRPDTPGTSTTQPGGGPLASDEECDRLRMALVTSQDAAVVQLLLEFCLPSAEEKRLKSEVSELHEVRNIICTFIHYLFIADPNLANVVFWQTYPRQIIPVAARGIPSLHICMDSVIDVFRKSGDLEAAVFCVDFVSHLAMHYNIGLLLDRATYLVEAMHHIFTSVLGLEEVPQLLLSCGPAFCRLGCAFPSLSPRLANILLTCMSMLSGAVLLAGGVHQHDNLVKHLAHLTPDVTEYSKADPCNQFQIPEDEDDYTLKLKSLSRPEQYYFACTKAMVWFNRLVHFTSAQRRLYLPPTIEDTSLLLATPSPSPVQSSGCLEK
uniref:Fanconi anemia group A protein n=1 Tax=Mesocestoides corti TaxID=53468 RepID=A0A5K3FK48_MESCO